MIWPCAHPLFDWDKPVLLGLPNLDRYGRGTNNGYASRSQQGSRVVGVFFYPKWGLVIESTTAGSTTLAELHKVQCGIRRGRLARFIPPRPERRMMHPVGPKVLVQLVTCPIPALHVAQRREGRSSALLGARGTSRLSLAVPGILRPLLVPRDPGRSGRIHLENPGAEAPS